MTGPNQVTNMARTIVGLREENDQLRAALRTASGLLWEGSVGNARAVIDTALAGVQADNEDSE